MRKSLLLLTSIMLGSLFFGSAAQNVRAESRPVDAGTAGDHLLAQLGARRGGPARRRANDRTPENHRAIRAGVEELAGVSLKLGVLDLRRLARGASRVISGQGQFPMAEIKTAARRGGTKARTRQHEQRAHEHRPF